MAQKDRLGWTLGLKSGSIKVHLYALWTTTPGPSQTHWSLDFEAVLAEDLSASKSSLIHIEDGDLNDAQRALIQTALFNALDGNSTKSRTTILRLLFPSVSGTPIRSDFLHYRLNGCELIHSVHSFLQPLQPITSVPVITPQTSSPTTPTPQTFLSLLSSSMGGIIAQSSSPSDAQTLSNNLTSQLTYRLSIPWITPPTSPPRRARIFWIQGRANIQASRQFYAAAHALGISLVVCDEPGHWMESDDLAVNPWVHYREAFVPLCIDADAGLAQRIVDAVRAYPARVDGVMCISDVRLEAVARACEVLGLATERAGAYKVAGDKGLTRRLVDGNGEGQGEESFVLEDAAGLEAVLRERGGRLGYPLIVKPCTGWNSDCVVKVRDEDELRAAVSRASGRHANSAARNTRVVVEPYIDGPEVDANFVVLDGEVLFCDITDDFPCPGDLVRAEGKTFAANFMETLMDVPTALPEDEQRIMKESLCKSIARCGFISGVFHCEARVRCSRALYKPRDDNGILDLHEEMKKGQPSCYLHEINARPPGYVNCVAALLAYGVDYYAIRLLLALGEEGKERIRALAQPFSGGKPQYTLGIAVLPPSKEGIMGSRDAVKEFLDANPDLAKHVVFYQTVKQRGERVQGPDSSELWCVGYVIVASRTGRKECLELAQMARKRFDYKLMDEA
ncbi:glutathione synthetase ATP-binding domain-like protein [Parathielavia appendiculata]|uniref:Glutathione synthetase ATP-binding domain-like protein n=1 Tax=Parathielavia appendiculata TaxID=2587402 RepID=A0AAN6U120_9PEZI|nr:glutathione synthetase ATP-binding domain-like protein [Parathielavia appendiculata]